jgi:hypothetical protein
MADHDGRNGPLRHEQSELAALWESSEGAVAAAAWEPGAGLARKHYAVGFASRDPRI